MAKAKAEKTVKAELVKEPESKTLIALDALKPEDIFVTEGGVEKIIAEVKELAKKELAKIEPGDITIEAERDRLISAAFKVTRTKTGLDDIGKDYVANLKIVTGMIDVRRRTLRETLDAMAAEIRGPVTAYENKQAARIKQHQDNMEELRALLNFEFEPDSEEVSNRLTLADKFDNWDFEEFKEQAATIKATVSERLSDKLNDVLQAEENAAEVERLRLRNKELEEENTRNRLAREATDKAADDLKKKNDDADAEIARKKKQADDEIEEKRKAEQKRIDDQKAADDLKAKEEKERQENEDHRRAVNRKAVDALLAMTSNNAPVGLTEAQAVAIVKGIILKKIPNVTIAY